MDQTCASGGTGGCLSDHSLQLIRVLNESDHNGLTATEIHLLEVIGRGLDDIINLIFGDLERSDQGHLLKNRVSVRDSAKFTIEH